MLYSSVTKLHDLRIFKYWGSLYTIKPVVTEIYEQKLGQ
jgi:hypothetical protein